MFYSFLQSNDPSFQRPSPKRSKYPEAKEDAPQAISAGSFMGTATKLIKNGEIGKFISKGIYPAPLHEGLTELQRKAESAFAYPLLDKVWQATFSSHLISKDSHSTANALAVSLASACDCLSTQCPSSLLFI